MKRRLIPLVATASLALLAVAPMSSAAPGGPVSGAIFTTDVTGVPVNLNHYTDKKDVYLNGGPGINAPDGAAGLPDDTYSFQVTNPNGKKLLSTDDVSCRQFTTQGGVIKTVFAGAGCTTGAHNTGTDGEDGGKTIQLVPYDDTPNPGGVYKVWVTPTSDLNCNAPGSRNCFVPKYSKTDNFKVKATAVVELDTRFWKPGNDTPLDGMAAGWIDTNGASNTKYSEYNPAVLAYHEAHVEAVEEGDHTVTVSNQAGCTIDHVTGAQGELYQNGSGKYRIPVSVAAWNAGDDITYRVEVFCK